MPMFAFTRLVLALKAVLDKFGEPAEIFFERYCAEREAQDEDFAAHFGEVEQDA